MSLLLYFLIIGSLIFITAVLEELLCQTLFCFVMIVGIHLTRFMWPWHFRYCHKHGHWMKSTVRPAAWGGFLWKRAEVPLVAFAAHSCIWSAPSCIARGRPHRVHFSSGGRVICMSSLCLASWNVPCRNCLFLSCEISLMYLKAIAEYARTLFTEKPALWINGYNKKKSTVAS